MPLTSDPALVGAGGSSPTCQVRTQARSVPAHRRLRGPPRPADTPTWQTERALWRFVGPSAEAACDDSGTERGARGNGAYRRAQGSAANPRPAMVSMR